MGITKVSYFHDGEGNKGLAALNLFLLSLNLLCYDFYGKNKDVYFSTEIYRAEMNVFAHVSNYIIETIFCQGFGKNDLFKQKVVDKQIFEKYNPK